MDTNFRKQTTELVTLHPFKGTGKINDRLRFDVSGLSGAETYTLAYVPSTGVFSWQNVDSVGVDTLYTADGALTGDRILTLGDYNLEFEGNTEGSATFDVYLHDSLETDYAYFEIKKEHEVLVETFSGSGDTTHRAALTMKTPVGVSDRVFEVTQEFNDLASDIARERTFGIYDTHVEGVGLNYVAYLSGTGVEAQAEYINLLINNVADGTNAKLELRTGEIGDSALFALEAVSGLDNTSAYITATMDSELRLQYAGTVGTSTVDLTPANISITCSEDGFGNTLYLGMGKNEDYFYLEANDQVTNNNAEFSVNPASGVVISTVNISGLGETTFRVEGEEALIHNYTNSAHAKEILYYGAPTGTGISDLLAQNALGGLSIDTGAVVACRVAVSAKCTTAGNGVGLTTDEALVAFYNVGIKNIGGTTSLVGTVQADTTLQADAGMADAVITISANDSDDILRIQFTPPSTAGTTSEFTVTAHVKASY